MAFTAQNILSNILSWQASFQSRTPAASPVILLPLLLAQALHTLSFPMVPPATHPLPCCLRWKLPRYPRNLHTPSSRFPTAKVCCHFSEYILVSLWGSLRGGTEFYPSCTFR